MDGHPTPATTTAMMEHKFREPARDVSMITALSNQSLLSRGKFAELGYVSLCYWEVINIYDGHTAKIIVYEKSVFTGWQCPCTRLWRTTLQAQVTNLNLNTLLLNGPTGQDSFNSLYNILSSAMVLEHIEMCNNDPTKP